jgi:hypothetical protein
MIVIKWYKNKIIVERNEINGEEKKERNKK